MKVKMKRGDVISLPELAEAATISDPIFFVADIIGGGMGSCLKLTHSGLSSAYAVKMIRPELMDSDSAWLRFMEELKIWFALSESTGVVEAICLARLNEIPCMCSHWMQGGTLRDKMRSGACSQTFVMNMLVRIIQTLAWVERKHKAIHRDLKPENILFDENGLAYVSDWGLAKLVEKNLGQTSEQVSDGEVGGPVMTQAGSFLGTVLYASPEQILGQRNIDHRSDIYSLGCIMYELECGKPPFTGRTVQEIARNHLRDKAPELGGGFFRRTNHGLEDVIARCLLKQPQERFQNYDELLMGIARVAKKRAINFPDASMELRPHRPVVGVSEFKKVLLAKIIKATTKHGVADIADVEPYIAEFEALVALGMWEKAKDIIEALYAPEFASPDSKWHLGHRIALNYALSLTMVSKADQAVSILAPLARMADLPSTYYVNYSLALLHTRNYGAAELICASGLRNNPDDKDLLGNYVIALQCQNKLTEALRNLGPLVKHGRDVHFLEETAGVMRRLASECGERDWLQLSDYAKKAFSLLLEAKHQNSRFIPARYALATVLLDLEQYESAAEEFKEVVQLAGDKNVLSELAICQIGRILLETGSYKECVAFCQKWMPKLNDSTGLNRSMAMALSDGWFADKSGKLIVVPQAIEFFEKAVKGDHTQVEDFCYLAELYARMNRFKEAKELFIQAEEKFSQHWLIPYYKGLVNNLAGLKEDAIQDLQLAARLAPFRSEPELKMGQIYSALGNVEMGECSKNQAEQKSAKRRAIAGAGLPERQNDQTPME